MSLTLLGVSVGVIAGGETYHVLLETGNDILLETGDFMLLESAP